MSLPGPVLIVGVGSPQGDDAAGWAVIERLRDSHDSRIESRNDITLHAVGGGERLLDLIDNQWSLILIDALVGDAPGSVVRLTWPGEQLEALHPGTTHGLGPAEALQLADSLSRLPPNVVIYAIGINSSKPCASLSPEVGRGVVEVVRRILEELPARGSDMPIPHI